AWAGLPLPHDGRDHALCVQRHDPLRTGDVRQPLPHDRVVGPAAVTGERRQLAHDPLVEARLGERTRRPLVTEAGARDAPSVVLLTDAVLDRDLDAVEEDLAEPGVAGEVAQGPDGD